MRLEEITYVFGQAVVIGAYGGNRLEGEMEEWNVRGTRGSCILEISGYL